MQTIQFPISFKFKITSLSSDFTATDSTGSTVAYVRQKMFKFKEEVLVYNNESKSQVNYKINADKWLDFSAAYNFTDSEGNYIGKVVRKGWKSLWKAEYVIIDQHEKEQYRIKEDNPFVKVMDSLFGEIPILGLFSGLLFNPTYTLSSTKTAQPVVQLKKISSLVGRRFQLDKLGALDGDDDDRIMLAVMMMLLLERSRG